MSHRLIAPLREDCPVTVAVGATVTIVSAGPMLTPARPGGR